MLIKQKVISPFKRLKCAPTLSKQLHRHFNEILTRLELSSIGFPAETKKKNLLFFTFLKSRDDGYLFK